MRWEPGVRGEPGMPEVSSLGDRENHRGKGRSRHGKSGGDTALERVLFWTS